MDNIYKLAEYLTEFAQRKQHETLCSNGTTPQEPSQHQEALRSLQPAVIVAPILSDEIVGS